MADGGNISASGGRSRNGEYVQAPWLRFLQALTGPWTWGNLAGWLGVIATILFIKGCLIDQYTIPTGSMEPTLQGDPRFFRGDRVLVNKWLYGPRIPFTTIRLMRWSAPERWDIVVFRATDPDAVHPVLIKRVVALPGEEVRIVEGNIHINGTPATPPAELKGVLNYTTQLEMSPLDKQRQVLRLAQVNQPLPMLNPHHPPVQTLYAEMNRLQPQVIGLDIDMLPDDAVERLAADIPHDALNLIHSIYVFVQPEMAYGINDEREYTLLPDDHYFMLGDNSAQSVDGRMYGWVPHNHLYGRAFAVWWPWAHRRDFSGFSRTWWGAALLYGIPALFIGAEIISLVRRKRRRT